MHYTNDKRFNILSVTAAITSTGEVRCISTFVNRVNGLPFTTVCGSSVNKKSMSVQDTINLLMEDFSKEDKVFLDEVIDSPEPPEVLPVPSIITKLTNQHCYCCGTRYDISRDGVFCRNAKCEAVKSAHNKKLFRVLGLGSKGIIHRIAPNYYLSELMYLAENNGSVKAEHLTKEENRFVLSQVKLIKELTTLPLYFTLLNLAVLDDKNCQADRVLNEYENDNTLSLMQIAERLSKTGNHSLLRQLNTYLNTTELSNWLLSVKGFNRIDS